MVTLEPRHISGLFDLWAHRWSKWFPLDLALWRQNIDRDPHVHPSRCWVIESHGGVAGCLVLKVPGGSPDWPGQNLKQAWISFLLVAPAREPTLSALLLDQAVSCLRSLGFKRVVYGSDPSHFFPGAPEEDAPLHDALDGAGFQAGDVVHDFVGDLRGYRVPDGVEHRLIQAGATFGPCDARTIPALLVFLDEHFPGRWAYETRCRLQLEPTPADILILKRDADVVGFCHVYHRGSRRIGPSIYWRAAIGDRYGGLGPIGVAPAFRGQGFGSALLARSIEHLRQLGVERAVIDWTTLTDFYGRFGFIVWRTYRHWHLEL